MTPLSSLSGPAVELENVSFAYEAGTPILAIKKFTVAPGEKIFVYGPSGSGKTTLLGLLAGVLPVQSGKIQMLGQDCSSLSSSARDAFRGAHIGYIFQMFNLIPYLTVRGNILLPLEIGALGKKIENPKERVMEIATSLGIAQFLDRPVTDLSVGQQQRVAAARALVGKPEILIADEPTSALDSDHREIFLNLLFSECEKTKATVLFVSHDRQLEKLFDRSVSLKEINSA
ncbi:MAG: ABC transporter ATP-binding protein [Bdellovibrionota bacterium]